MLEIKVSHIVLIEGIPLVQTSYQALHKSAAMDVTVSPASSSVSQRISTMNQDSSKLSLK